MKAFVEWLWCPSGIVRVGKSCEKYWDDFEFSVVVAVPWSSAFFWLIGRRPVKGIVKGLVAPEAKPLTHAHAGAIIAALEKSGIKAKWDRARRRPISGG